MSVDLGFLVAMVTAKMDRCFVAALGRAPSGRATLRSILIGSGTTALTYAFASIRQHVDVTSAAVPTIARAHTSRGRESSTHSHFAVSPRRGASDDPSNGAGNRRFLVTQRSEGVALFVEAEPPSFVYRQPWAGRL